MPNRGILIHAYNNDKINYGLIALCNALCIKYNLNEKVSLITNNDTIDSLIAIKSEELVYNTFDKIIIKESISDNQKRYGDSNKYHMLPWNNSSRSDSYSLSPYDETILIDSDYLIMDKTLNLLWGSIHDVMIADRAIPLNHDIIDSSEKWIQDYSIKMYWATCIYFKKSKKAETLFDIVNHIKTYYDYYAMVYGFNSSQYRNDYSFSIAVHMMNGFVAGNDEIKTLPFSLFTSFDWDDLIDIPEKNEFIFLVNDRQNHQKFTLTKIKNMNVHVLNKFALERQAEKMIDLYLFMNNLNRNKNNECIRRPNNRNHKKKM